VASQLCSVRSELVEDRSACGVPRAQSWFDRLTTNGKYVGGGLIFCFAFAPPVFGFDAPDSSKYKLDFSTELRVFPERAIDPRQADSTLSFSALGRADYEWDGGKTKLAISPFVRHDSADTERSHADLREFEVRHRNGDFDWRGGIGKVFWGTTESVHLVDIINQTDAVESVDGEDKLGQPMASLAWSSPYGVFTGFVLPYFRERNLPGVAGRLRAPVRYEQGTAQYESSRGNRHVDAAVRWSYSHDNLDVGVSHFVGTAREPRFALLPASLPSSPEPTLLPIYDQIRQTGLDFNAVNGGWIWKLEALHQANRIKNYNAAVGGFEYTLPNTEPDAPEIGLLSELAWDSRGRASPSPFQRDIFFAMRLSMNDVAGSEMLAGVMQDLQHSGRFVSIDASRRVGNDARLALKLRLIDSSSPRDPLSALTQDDHLLLEYTQHF
jgi:hypothetical protein